MRPLARKGESVDVFMVESPNEPGAFKEWPGPVRLMMLGTGGGIGTAMFIKREDAERYAADSTPAGRVVRLVLSRGVA